MEISPKTELPAAPAAQSARPAVQAAMASSNRRKAAKPKPKTATKAESKQDSVLALLRRKDGATISAIMKATGWQRHSVHGFFAGVVRRKLKLNLSRTGEGERASYRIGAVGRQRTKHQDDRVISRTRKQGRLTRKRAR